MTPSPISFFAEARRSFHAAVLSDLLHTDAKGVPTNADRESNASVQIAKGILSLLGTEAIGARLAGQTSGNKFEDVCGNFLKITFPELAHLRPGRWDIKQVKSKNRLTIAQYQQYSHLIALDKAAKRDKELAAALGSDYTITPDIIVARFPEDDDVINNPKELVDDTVSKGASLRKRYSQEPLLHASISCKWTMRSDRAQNARSEALNLIRNRKGGLPHIAVITAEPLPSRIASLALGTGDIDCVYHFALPEMLSVVENLDLSDSLDMLNIMVQGKRLKDIADLPLDLAV